VTNVNPALAAFLLQSAPRVSFVSLRALSLVLACRPRRCQRLRSAPQARPVLVSLDQSLIREALPGSAGYEAIEPCYRVVLHVAFVQAKRELVNIAIQMLRAGVMIDANKAALKDGKDAFDSVSRHVIANILARAVVDRGVNIARIFNADISAKLVSVQRRTCFNMLMDCSLNGLLISPFNRRRKSAAPPRSRIPRTGVLPTLPRPALSFLPSCLFVSLPPTYVSSISTMP